MLPLSLLFFILVVSSPCVLSISVPPASRLTDGDASWALAIRKGSLLFHELESGCYPDKVHPLNLGELLAIGFHIGDDNERRWPPIFKAKSGFDSDVVKFLKWTERIGAFYTAEVRRTFFSPWKETTTYSNEYSPLNGLIAALDINPAAGETLTWSDVTFAMWEAVTAYTKSDIKDLRHIAHHGVDNLFTNLIIDRAMNGRAGQQIPIKRFGAGTEAFLALLGTPAGGRVGYFLMQHKRQLGKKTIAEAVVFGDRERDLVFVLKDMSIPRGGAMVGANATALDGRVGASCFQGE